METKIILLALEKLTEEYLGLKREVGELRSELNAAKSGQITQSNSDFIHMKDDELLDYKEVQTLLGICYNSLKKLIDSGQIVPIRLNERRIRFSKQSILDYIKSKSIRS